MVKLKKQSAKTRRLRRKEFNSKNNVQVMNENYGQEISSDGSERPAKKVKLDEPILGLKSEDLISDLDSDFDVSGNRYKENLKYRRNECKRLTEKYKIDQEYRSRKIRQSVEKYAGSNDHRSHLKRQSIEKYATNENFQTHVKKQSIEKYATNEEHRANVKKQSTEKYATNEEHQENVKKQSKEKYATNEEHRANVKKHSVEKYSTNETHRTTVKKQLIEAYANDEQVRENVRRRAANQYLKKTADRRNLEFVIDDFKAACLQGPECVCCVCHRLLFQNQVKSCIPKMYDEHVSKQCISFEYIHVCSNECSYPCKQDNNWICPTCDKHLKSGKTPPQAACNKLEMAEIPEQLSDLNTLEEQLIALTIPFMKIVPLPKGKQAGIKGPVICVKSDIKETTKVLPRPMTESQIVGIKLKRRLEYRGHSNFKMVHLKKIEDAFKTLKELNPLYENVELDSKWIDETGTDLDNLTDQSPIDLSDDQGDIVPNLLELTDGESYEMGGLANDTCLQPLDITADVVHELENHILSVAPAERNKPHSLLNTPNDEMKAFPTLFPHGINGYDEARDIKLSRFRYYNARLLSADLRFAKNTSYIFYAQAQVELEKLLSGISIQCRKGTKTMDGRKITASMITDTDQLMKLMQSGQAFSHFEQLRGSPQYWKRTMNDLFAMIRQLGVPTWFCTFSAAELSRWPEVVEVIARQSGKPVDFDSLNFAEKCELLRSNPVTAVRMFYHRISELMRLIKSPANPIGKLTDYFYRVEFQQRGAPHIHCLFWIENSPKFGIDSDEAVCSFIDQYVSECNADETDELHEIVQQVQSHSSSHTKSCKKGNKACRFNFPRPVMDRTCIVRPKSRTDPQEDQQVPENAVRLSEGTARICLEKLSQQLNEDLTGRSSLDVLNEAGLVNFEELRQALSVLAKKPSVYLRRGINDVWINCHSPNLLRAWNANMDIQFVIDAYSCVMYILSYISKSEHELSELMQEAKLEMANDPNCGDLKTKMKKLGFVYFDNREVSVQEAVVRTTGLNLKESSRNTVFVSTDENQIRLSKPLLQIMNHANHEEDCDDIWATCLYDKYKNRPDTTSFNKMCQATFASNYRFISNSEGETGVAKGNPNVHALQNNLGYIMKRTRTPPAVIRFPKFSSEKEPEKHHMSLLKLYLPHRSERALKPEGFVSFKDFYDNGAVKLTQDDDTKFVKAIVQENRAVFECLSEYLQEAWQQIQRGESLEDAWASIAPQVEQERLDAIPENEVIHEPCATDDIPDLNNSSESERRANSLCSVELLGESTRSNLKTMNTMQRKIFYYVRQWCLDEAQGKNPEPFYLYVNGGAGVGKSHLIKCIYNEASKLLRNGESPLDTTVLLTAPTGTAAFNIGGYTLHSALKIPRTNSKRYEPLSDETLNTLFVKLHHLKLLIIDEISMVDRKVLAFVHGRLKQIKQIRNSDRNAWFGNVCILAVGDFYQLPPVRAKSLMKPDSSMGIDLWHDLFTMVELTEIMRQRNDLYFAELLNALRQHPKGHPLHDSYDETLRSRVAENDIPDDTLCVFATNKSTDKHNAEILKKTCSDVIELKACDFEKDVTSGRLTTLTQLTKGSNDDLVECLQLAVGARVMLTRNIDVTKGLVNGAFGTVDRIDLSANEKNSRVFVTFDSNRRNRGQESRNQNSTAVTRHEETMANAKSVTRRQFPLKLAWACTIHKTQGMTTEKCVIDFQGIFAPGQAYVGLSRVTSLQGLFIKNYDPKKIYRSEEVHNELQNMRTLKMLMENDENPNATFISIVHHNVQGLHSKMADIRNYKEMLTDVIMINETWLKQGYNETSVAIDNYTLHRQDRPNNKDRGGVAIYVRVDLSAERINTNVTGIEHVALAVMTNSTVFLVVSIYKCPSQNVENFKTSMDSILRFIRESSYENVVIAGDFNENLLSNCNHAICKLFTEKHGYTQHVTSSTHSRFGSLLDHVYVKTTMKISCEILPTYFSDHEAVKVTLSPPDENDMTEREITLVPEVTCLNSQASQSRNEGDDTNQNQLSLSEIQSGSDKMRRSELENVQSYSIIPCGLRNLGNTCFVNTILQVLFSVKELQPVFTSTGILSTTLTQLKAQIYSGNRCVLSPTKLFDLPHMGRWPIDVQQDAHDFLLWMLQSLHTEQATQQRTETNVLLNNHERTWEDYLAEHPSSLTEIVAGQYKRTQFCQQCRGTFARFEYFRCICIYLNSKEVVLEEPTQLNDIPCRFCPSGQTKETTEMTRCPKILFALLMRFNGLSKDNRRINLVRNIVTKNGTRYALAAIVNHSGNSSDSGHYTASIISEQGKWYKCDDSYISEMKLSTSSSVAYILVFRRLP